MEQLENATQRRYREYSLKLHIDKLNDIKKKGSHRIDNSCPKTKEIIVFQKQGKDFVKKSKKEDISKENSKFFGILGEISAGKRETVTQKILNSAKETKIRKSLNLSVRKKKELRIFEENETLIKRIEQIPPDLSIDKLKKEWLLISKYKNIISRKTPRYSSSQFVQTCYLPPLLNAINKDKKNPSKLEDTSFERQKKNLTANNFNKKNNGRKSERNATSRTEKTNKDEDGPIIYEKDEANEERFSNSAGFFISEVIESQLENPFERKVSFDKQQEIAVYDQPEIPDKEQEEFIKLTVEKTNAEELSPKHDKESIEESSDDMNAKETKISGAKEIDEVIEEGSNLQ